MRKKSLLIGINYEGQSHALQGCRQDVRNMVHSTAHILIPGAPLSISQSQFLVTRGYPTDERSMVIMADDRKGPFYPSGHNILAAMDWLVSEVQNNT